MFKVGVDVGGTFTDVFGLDDLTGKIFSGKHLTIPNDLKEGVIGALERAGVNLADVDQVIHGSTIAMNTLIQRNYYGWWPKVALVTTEGFRDTMEMGRFNREHMYDLHQEKIKPLIKRRFRFTVPEKIDAKGKVIKRLDVEVLRSLALQFKKIGIESVALVFLNSYVNPANELKAKQVLKEELPRIPVTTSFETSSKIRELGRIVTTAVRAILIPVMEQYISGLESVLRDKGFRGKFFLVKSDGGLATAEMMKRCPEAMLLSGPAAGVFSGLNIGTLAGESNILCQDMGGTSYDVCIIEDGQILQTTEYQLDVDMPIITPILDVRSIGTGGGSIAWIDTGGSFRVGPQSAGSKPGPACYGFGGESPTVTDANLLLGRIDETLGGKLKLDRNAAYASIKTKIADPLEIDPIEAAEGIIRISCNNMARAISLVTTDRGRDPRNFVPTVFGGAGPMHICFVAELLGIAKAVVPAASGVCSAEGAVMMPLKIQFERTFLKDTASLRPEELNDLLRELHGKVLEALVEQGTDEKSIDYRNIAEMRYVGQTYEVPVEMPFDQVNEERIADLIERFHKAHEKEYFVCNRDFSTALVNIRVEGTATVEKIEYPTYASAEYEVGKAIKLNKKVIFDGESRDTVVFDYEKLIPSHKIKGPSVIEMDHSCCVVAPNWDVTVDERRNLILNRVKERGIRK